MRLDDKTFITYDEEGSSVESRIARRIEEVLTALNLDTYNEQYVIRITIDRIDPGSPDRNIR